MRTESSIKNIMCSFGGQIINLVMKLVVRAVFIKILTSQYLGLDGLFSNILSILCLVELGVGPAMTFSLYKPLAENKKENIKSLMKLYKKLYSIIGFAVLVLGISITPFLSFFIKEMPNIPNIKFIYMIFVLNTGITYFYTYKRSLLEADQKRYITMIYHYIFNVILNIAQILILILTKNYILYLLLQTIIIVIENYIISLKVDKMYPYIKEKNINDIEIKTKKQIQKNVSAMFCHKIGGVVVTGTDNLLISKFVGLIEVGLYSNYLLIINAVQSILAQIFTSLVASVGNLVASETREKTYNIFKKVLFLNFWLYSFSTVCLVVLFNDFIILWIGKKYIFSVYIVIIIAFNFFITGMRRTVLTFKDASGLYWNDRYKALFEAGINLIVSILLAKKYGIIGILLGTTFSTLTTCFWIEPYILYKNILKEKLIKYFRKIIQYFLITVVVTIITYILCKYIFITTTLIGFVGKMLICIGLPNLVYILIFRKTQDFKYFVSLIEGLIDKIKNKK